MIFVTGDTHSDVTRLSTKNFPEQKHLTKDDFVIILGDFGLIWDKDKESGYEKYWLDWLDGKPFTTLFIDGNHENFDRLNAMPVRQWHGGQVHEIRPSVLHMMRGEVFELQGKTFFTFGGGKTHDILDGILSPSDKTLIRRYRKFHKQFRIEHQSWWKEELPSDSEMEYGIENLAGYSFRINYILTHSPSVGQKIRLCDNEQELPDVLMTYLEKLETLTFYDHWFFAHMHEDRRLDMKNTCIYEKNIRIE